jgi:hypothetical protein
MNKVYKILAYIFAVSMLKNFVHIHFLIKCISNVFNLSVRRVYCVAYVSCRR